MTTVARMRPMRLRLVITLLMGVGLLAACGQPETPSVPAAPAQRVTETTETATHRVTLVIGPMVIIPVSDPDAPGMTMIDEGKPVNHHVAFHIHDKGSGARALDVPPTITITNVETGAARVIRPEPQSAFALACLQTKHLSPDRLHFGDNLYLADGEYTFTLRIGSETAVFEDIPVRAAG